MVPLVCLAASGGSDGCGGSWWLVVLGCLICLKFGGELFFSLLFFAGYSKMVGKMGIAGGGLKVWLLKVCDPNGLLLLVVFVCLFRQAIASEV